MDIRTLAVEPSKKLHLRDANDQLIYADEAKTLPVCVNLHSPGSKTYAKAKASQNNRLLEKLKRKGKFEQSAEQSAAETAEFLADVTESWENMQYGSIIETRALSLAVYTDESIGFIADQVNKELGDWSNFTKHSKAS